MAPLYHQRVKDFAVRAQEASYVRHIRRYSRRRHPDNNCTAGGVRIMSQPNPFDEAAFNKYMDELPDLLTGERTGPDGVFPDGRFYDYDDALQATIETAPDGRRYIGKFENGDLAGPNGSAKGAFFHRHVQSGIWHLLIRILLPRRSLLKIHPEQPFRLIQSRKLNVCGSWGGATLSLPRVSVLI